MNDLDERLRAAKARNEIAVFNDDTAIEEDLAALYLCVSPKKLAELRGNGGGPQFVKAQDPKAAGRNQPVSYVMGELRKWRKVMSAGSNLEVARRQGLVSWVVNEEPFWCTKSDLVICSAMDQSDSEWAGRFINAISCDQKVRWLPPQKALELVWAEPEIQNNFAEDYFETLINAKECVLASIARSSVAQALLDVRSGAA